MADHLRESGSVSWISKDLGGPAEIPRLWGCPECRFSQPRRPKEAVVVFKQPGGNQLISGDTLVVWRLDRLGRSLRHLVELVGEIEEREIAFRSLTEAIDTATPAGRLQLHLFAALAEFERELIRERATAGREAARARGRLASYPGVRDFARNRWPLRGSLADTRG